MRLIDADRLKGYLYENYVMYDHTLADIDAQPTVDAEPVRHGHWIGESQTKFRKLLFPSRVFKCSVCGNYLDFDGVNVGRGSANYCPNCGAKMDGEREEDETD